MDIYAISGPAVFATQANAKRLVQQLHVVQILLLRFAIVIQCRVAFTFAASGSRVPIPPRRRFPDLLRKVFVGCHDLAVRERETGHESGVNLRSGDRRSLELKIGGRASVVNDDGVVAEVCRGPARCVNAHVTHRTYDDDVLDTLCIEQLLQPGIAKRVRIVLKNDRLAFDRLNRGIDFHTRRSGSKDGRVLSRAFVTDIDDLITLRPCRFDNSGRVGGRLRDTD